MKVWVLVFVVVQAVMAGCPSTTFRDSYSVLPPLPLRPTKSVPTTALPASGSVIVQDHKSEVVVLPRPPVPADLGTATQSNCPHLQSGLVDWHNPAIWTSGKVPAGDGSNITLCSNCKVLVSQCSLSGVYGVITVPASSQLILGDAPITLNALGIVVYGALWVGSQSCRLRNNITITLHGTRPEKTLGIPAWTKGIYVTGTLDVHGQQYFPTWTRLASSATSGSQWLYVQDVVNWQVGQTIVVTTTQLKDSRDWHQNEVLTIAGVYTAPTLGPSVCGIQLTTPLQFTHHASIAYQAEVALLSRNVVVQGSNNSEPADKDPVVCTSSTDTSTYPCENSLLGFGGHIMIATSAAIGRVSGTLLYRMGQTNVLGRYPFHMHLLGANGNASYIRDSAVWRSFYRCYTVHGTNNSLVSSNVAYDVIGHCYYLEDGVEEDNTFEFNLAAFVHFIGSPALTGANAFWSFYLDWVYQDDTSLLLPADVAAGGFYITNAHNSFVGNAASGGWSGFVFPELPRPVKLFRNIDMTPSARPLKLFDGNTAHSSGYWWAHAGTMYVGGQLEHVSDTSDQLRYNPGRAAGHPTCATDPMDSYGVCFDELWMRFTNTKMFLASNRGLQHWGDRSEFEALETHDCGMGVNVFGQVWINNMLVQCRSQYLPEFVSGCPTAADNYWDCHYRDLSFWTGFLAFQWYDNFQAHIITNSTFRNCNDKWPYCLWDCDTQVVWQLLSHSDQYVPQVMQATRGIVYQNVTATNLWRFSTRDYGNTVSGRLQSWRDMDGSASMQSSPTMIGSTWAGSWWKLSNDCTRAPAQMDMWLCPLTSMGSVLFKHNPTQEALIGSEICSNGVGLPCPDIGVVYHYGQPLSDGMNVTANTHVTGYIDSRPWVLQLDAGSPKVLTITEVQVSPDVALVVGVKYPPGTTLSVVANGASWCWPDSTNLCSHQFTPVSSLSSVYDSATGDVYYFDGSMLFVRVVQQNDNSLGPGYWMKDQSTTDLAYFTRANITIPRISYEYGIVVTASCPASTGSSDAYCNMSATSNTPVPSPTPSPSRSPSRSKASQTPSRSLAASSSISFSSSRTMTASLSRSLAISPSISLSVSRTFSLSRSQSMSGSRTATASFSSSPSRSSSPSQSSTQSRSATSSTSSSPTSTGSTSLSPSRSASISATRSVSASSSSTPTPTSSPTASLSRSPSATASTSLSVSRSPSISPTRSLSPSRSRSASTSSSPSSSRSASRSASASASASASRSPSRSASASPSR